jgi:hypothetical protein
MQHTQVKAVIHAGISEMVAKCLYCGVDMCLPARHLRRPMAIIHTCDLCRKNMLVHLPRP